MALLTRYVNHAIVGGNDDGTSEADAWTYLYQATGAIKTDAGTNNYKIYVKASEDYGVDDGGAGSPLESDDAGHDGAGGDAGALIYLDQQAPALTTPNVFEGYFDTPGDGGIVTFECNYTGASKLTNGIRFPNSADYFTVFKNFDVLNASGIGVDGDLVADNLTFKNVRAKGNGTFGFQGDDDWAYENCVAENNGGIGFDGDSFTTHIASIATNNVGGIAGHNLIAYASLAYNNGSAKSFHCLFAEGHILGCTIDGNNEAAAIGIHQDDAISILHVANTIIFDCNTGILSDADWGDAVISRNNLFNSNNDDGSAFATEYDGGDGAPSTGNGVGDLGHVTGAPAFDGAADHDPGANAQKKGLDCHYAETFWASFDAANNPPTPA